MSYLHEIFSIGDNLPLGKCLEEVVSAQRMQLCTGPAVVYIGPSVQLLKREARVQWSNW